MANEAALMIQWGMPMHGRETRALEEFATHMQWWGELKAKGTIAEFRVYGFTTGDMSSRSGFVIVEGSIDQVNKLRSSEEFRSNINRVYLCVDHVQVDVVEHGNAMMTRMQSYGAAMKASKL